MTNNDPRPTPYTDLDVLIYGAAAEVKTFREWFATDFDDWRRGNNWKVIEKKLRRENGALRLKLQGRGGLHALVMALAQKFPAIGFSGRIMEQSIWSVRNIETMVHNKVMETGDLTFEFGEFKDYNETYYRGVPGAYEPQPYEDEAADYTTQRRTKKS